MALPNNKKKTTVKTTRLIAALAALALLSGGANAAGPFRNPDNKNPNDPGEGTYPVPYKKPVASEIGARFAKVGPDLTT